MSQEDFYEGREQTLVKHFILKKYLERFAIIIGSHWQTITYVDCFSGPWNARSQDFEDSSFFIALTELRKAHYAHKAKGKSLSLRCFFLEREPEAYQKLKEFADGITDAHVQTKNSELSASVGEILTFVKQGGRTSFPFVFIDPTGWTGFDLNVIAPLLRVDPGEVLINFMTGHIRRFIASPQSETQESFERLFGSANFRAKIQGLAHQDREDAAVLEYSENVRRTGHYRFIAKAVVFHPEINRTHFHLIYATRNSKGIEVFKDVEKRAMQVMESARAKAQQRKREESTRQPDLFNSEVMRDSSHYDALRECYLTRSKKIALDLLRERGRVRYDDVWAAVLSEPLTWESDLKGWIQQWQSGGVLHIEGMTGKQRVPHIGKQNFLIWKVP
jgi:three-Cys-motif partner protein